MRFIELNDDNYMMFAIKHYNNPQAVTQEDFQEDLKKFKYIKRLLKRYQKTGELKTHLLLNHFICLYNVFDDAATPLLFYKIDKELWAVLKTFLLFLHRVPEFPKTKIHDIEVDIKCLGLLNKV
jgi:hypothetical protein|tara:strand:- start:285 stop:656 length:372 start_codon:yes stop_codon:yes gene_type:complete